MGKDFQQKPHGKAVTISAEELPEVLGQILAPTKHSPPLPLDTLQAVAAIYLNYKN